jgi:hypothetical protein
VLPGKVGDKDGPGENNYKFSTLTSCPAGTGNFNFFKGWDYRNNEKRLRPQNRWRGFKKRETDDNGKKIDHKVNPKIEWFENTRNTANQKAHWFFDLYKTQQPWPSYFGSLAADEDFVETYVLMVLTNAQPKLTNLQIKVYYTDHDPEFVDIPASLGNRSDLINKMKCIIL